MRYLVYILLFFGSLSALQAQSKLPQNLLSLGDEELLALFNEMDGDSIAQERVARTYLNRARKEKDTIKMARGYDRLARIFHHEKNIMFADSIIALTEDMKHITYPALGYIIKGNQFYLLGDLTKSTTAYLKAYEIAIEQENIQQQVFIMDLLIFAKSIWGNKNDALELQHRRFNILQSENYKNEIKKATRKGANIDIEQLFIEDEIVALENYIFCYMNLNKLDSVKVYFKRVYDKMDKYNWVNKDTHLNWLKLTELELHYRDRNYTKALNQADSILKAKEHDDFTLFNLFLFKGLANLELDNILKGIESLKSADSIVDNSEVLLRPFDRVLYEKLLSFYESTDSTEKRIEYLTKLIYLDSVFKIKYQYFDPQLIKNYETPLLLAEKEELINELQLKNKSANTSKWAIVGLLFFSTLGFFYYFKRQLIYKRRFEKLVVYSENGTNHKRGESSVQTKPSGELIENILSNLSDFERKREYLSPKISLGYLAKRFDTNSKYLSQVINLEKDKNFTQYINDLRVTYAFKELAANPTFRKFTIKAIANECGFKTGESFSRAFYKKFGIYPSYYLKSLEKKQSAN
ncbi:helix-turn-helix domain-containing protein [Altibacter sp.]|uniref:helix-turn-helix domain-containing protein n=1 Tax=Altibacter sp. TaxID=2024823 RepID=UPI000C96CDAB|nr:helix-turn-helix domain-containing protein [Altibacter sp.]MAP54858.1 hypothetical protein [Altibacter sp.]